MYLEIEIEKGGENMWIRADLKSRAKKVLKGNYWQAFLVSLVILITGGSHNRGEVGSSAGSSGGAEASGGAFFDFEIALIVGTVILLIIILRIFIGYVLEVGGRKYFIQLSDGESEISCLGYGFKNNNYFNIFWTMLLRSIFVIYRAPFYKHKI